MRFNFKKHKELILGIAVLIFAAVYLIASSSIIIRIQSSVDAAFVPRLLGILLLVLGAIQTVRGALHVKRYVPYSGGAAEKNDVTAVLLTFALIIGYVAILKPVGFLLSSIVFLFLQMLVLAPKDKRKLWLFAVVAVCFSALVYFAFRYGLDLMLPQGILNI